MHKEVVFQQKPFGKSQFHLLTDWSGQPVLTNGKRPKISSCRGNTTSRQGIKQLGIFLVLFFLYFPMEVAGDHIHSSQGKTPGPSSKWQPWHLQPKISKSPSLGRYSNHCPYWLTLQLLSPVCRLSLGEIFLSTLRVHPRDLKLIVERKT